MNFTQEQLEAGFKLVQNEKHWKNPINSRCSESEYLLIERAIVHFTATVPTFFEIGPAKKDFGRFKKGETIYSVIADGYYLGPAGDH